MIVCKCDNTRHALNTVVGDGIFEIHGEHDGSLWLQNNGHMSDAKVVIFCPDCNRHNIVQADHGEDKEGVLKRLTIEGYYNW